MKRKHLELAILVFGGMFLLGTLYYFPTLTGFTSNDMGSKTLISYNKNFEIKFFDAYYKGNIVSADFTLEENAGKNRNLAVNYEMFNSNGEIFGKGSTDIVLGANEDKSYGFSFKPDRNSESASLGVEIIDKETEERVYSSITLWKSTTITGNAISNGTQPVKAGGIFFVFVAILGCLFYLVKMIYARKERKDLAAKVHQGRLITLR